MKLSEALKGYTITDAREDADDQSLIYLHLGRDEAVIAIQVFAWGMVETKESTLQ